MSFEWWLIIALAIGHAVNLVGMGLMLRGGSTSSTDLWLQGLCLSVPGGILLFLTGVLFYLLLRGWSQEIRRYFRVRESRARQKAEQAEQAEQVKTEPYTVAEKAKIVYRVFPDGSREVVSIDGHSLNVKGQHEAVERQTC